MKIAFSKLSSVAYPFRLDFDNMLFEGKLVKKSPNLASLSMTMKGAVAHTCDACGREIELCIDECVDLLVSDGIYKDETHILSDVVEFFGGEIDLSELAQGELQSYLSDYFYCESCK